MNLKFLRANVLVVCVCVCPHLNGHTRTQTHSHTHSNLSLTHTHSCTRNCDGAASMRTVGRRAYECRYENKKTNKAADKNKQPTDNWRQTAAVRCAALRCVRAARPPSPICNFNFAYFLLFFCCLFCLLSPVVRSICIIKVKVVKKMSSNNKQKKSIANCLDHFAGKAEIADVPLSRSHSLYTTLVLPLSPSLSLSARLL